jgi:hypothetical protein
MGQRSDRAIVPCPHIPKKPPRSKKMMPVTHDSSTAHTATHRQADPSHADHSRSRAKVVVIFSEALETIGERIITELRPAADDHTRRLATVCESMTLTRRMRPIEPQKGTKSHK